MDTNTCISKSISNLLAKLPLAEGELSMGGVVVLEVPGDPGVTEVPGVTEIPGVPGTAGVGDGVKVISAGDDTVSEK